MTPLNRARLAAVIRAYVPSTLPEVLAWYERFAKGEPGAIKAAQEVSTMAAMTTGQRRATLAVDVAQSDVAPADRGVTSLTLSADVPRAAWAALFVDDLQWYAIDEIAHLR